MSQTRRALWLADTWHSVDGDRRDNPESLFAQSIPQIIGQILRIVCGNGVAIIDRTAAPLLQLPTGELPLRTDVVHPFVAMLRAAGYTISSVHRWFHVKHRDHGSAWFGLEEFCDSDHFALRGDTPEQTTRALATWHTMTGHVWRGGSGDAGNAILRAQKYRKHGRTGHMVGAEWWSWDGPDGEPIEAPYLPSMWRLDGPAPDVIYGLDRVRAYLSAMTCTDVAAEKLRHTPDVKFTPKKCGWWQVRTGEWLFEHMMPDPAGYTGEPGELVWLTTPTVALLDELSRDGMYEFSIHDAWTGTATPVIKSYGTELRKLWQDTAGIDDPILREQIRAGLKGAYRKGHGYWRSHQSKVQRPDWSAAITATARTNLWRRIWTVIENGGDFHGPRPYMIDTDNVYYTQPTTPAGWTIWDSGRPDLDDVTQLGHWRTMPPKHRKIREKAAA